MQPVRSDWKRRAGRAVGCGRDGRGLFLARRGPRAVRAYRFVESRQQCVRDGSQATNGSCPQGRSEAEWRTARPPERPAEAEGDMPKIMQLVSKAKSKPGRILACIFVQIVF